ncbi:MAG: hypothetical protein WCD70_15205 [Alphaproteobacteria bacterium]
MATKLYAAPPQFAKTATHIRQDMPVYRLNSACYFQDRFLEPGTVISLRSSAQPNIEMFPLNKLAYDDFVIFLEIQDDGGKKWQDKTGMAYIPKLPQFLNQWKRVNAIAAEKGISLERAAAMPAPIMVATPKEPMFSLVDTTIATQMPIEVGASV